MINEIIKAQKDAQQRRALNMWTVYDHPVDYPHTFVARRFEISQSLEPVATTDILRDTKLHVIRACLRCAGLTPFPRKEGDAPPIMETWL
jgi:hypothetical protein